MSRVISLIPKEIRQCPACNGNFFTKVNEEKITCTKKCFKVLFPKKTGENYITKCFKIHKRECVVCNENRVVDVHHYDKNHNNNDIKNLIPLCPTCHRCAHYKKYKYSVLPKIEEFRKKFISGA